MQNLDIRIMAFENKVRYQDIAKKMGISRQWLSELMRRNLSPEKRQQIKQAIMELRDDTCNSGTVSGV